MSFTQGKTGNIVYHNSYLNMRRKELYLYHFGLQYDHHRTIALIFTADNLNHITRMK